MLRKHVGIFLLCTGLILILSAVSMKLYTKYNQNRLVREYNKSVSYLEKSDSSAGNKPEKAVDNIPADLNGTVGILYIPKINLTVAVNEGIDTATLKYSVGHFPGTAMPGNIGNFCVAGHRSYTYGEYFNRLNEIKKGDLIIVKSQGHTFTYKVYAIQVVMPTEISVLDKTSDAEVTLITCTPIRVGTQRLIVKGTLYKTS